MVRKLQAASGALFGTFLAAHLINTWLAAAGGGAYERVQGVLASGYQWPVLEWLILGSVLVHAGCAITRWRRESRGRLPWRARLHRYSGIFLMVVIVGHVTAVRLLPAWFGIRTGFDGVAFTLAWAPAIFYPYYTLLGLAGAYHGLNGALVAASRLGWPLRLPHRWLYAGAGAGGVLTLVALLGFGGVLFDTGDPWQSPFARLYLRLMGG